MASGSRWFWVAICCGVLTGCGDDGEVGSTGGSGGAATGGGGANTGGFGAGGTTGGAGGSGGAEPLTYRVELTDDDNSPIEGAGVALDFVGGDRMEIATNASGVAIFVIASGTEPDIFVAHKDGYSFASIPVETLAELTNFGLLLTASPDLSAGMQLSGAVANMVDPLAGRLYVSAYPDFGPAAPSSDFVGVGSTDYNVRVPEGQPFTLRAFETSLGFVGKDLTRSFDRAWSSEEAGIAAPTTIDIDLADPTPVSQPFSFTLAAPADAGLASTGVAIVDVRTAGGLMGGSTACLHDSATDTYQCDGITFAGGAGSIADYVVGEETRIAGGYGRQTSVTLAGLPTGIQSLSFLNPPDVSAPSGPGPHPVDTQVEFTVASGGGVSVFELANITAGSRLVGIAFAAPSGVLRVPALPSTSDSAAHYEDSMVFDLHTCSLVGSTCIATGSETWEASPPAN